MLSAVCALQSESFAVNTVSSAVALEALMNVTMLKSLWVHCNLRRPNMGRAPAKLFAGRGGPQLQHFLLRADDRPAEVSPR